MRALPLITAVFISIFSLAQAPQIDWSICYGGNDYDQGYSVCQSTDGFLYTAGNGRSTDIDFIGAHGDIDGIVIKTNVNGAVEWSRCYGGSGMEHVYDVAPTNDGGCVFTGSSNSNDGDLHGNHGYDDLWVVRLEANGDTIWSRCYGGSSGDTGWKVEQTKDGGFFVAGMTTSIDYHATANNGDQDYFVLRLDSLGNVLWSNCYGGSMDEWPYSMDVTEDGGCILTGDANSNNGDVTNHIQELDNWVVKLDSIGNIEWAKCIGGTDNDAGWSIIQTTDGGYVSVGGSYSDNLYVPDNNGAADIWIVKLNLNGDTLWSRNYGGSQNEFARSVFETIEGNLIVAGSTFSYDGNIHGAHGDSDYWILKLNENGDTLWTKTLGGTAEDIGWDAIQLSNGAYLMTGYSRSTDGDLNETYSSYDIWTVLLETDEINTIGNIEKKICPTMFPNPCKEILNVDFGEVISDGRYEIVTLTGQVVLSQLIQNEKMIQVNTKGLATGTYVTRIIIDKGDIVSKLCIKE